MARLLAVFELSYRAQEGAIVALLAVIAVLLVLVVRGRAPRPAARPASPPAPVAARAGLPDHLPALIAAAVHMALEGQPHRILHIEPTGSDWASEGRRDIFSSHRIR